MYTWLYVYVNEKVFKTTPTCITSEPPTHTHLQPYPSIIMECTSIHTIHGWPRRCQELRVGKAQNMEESWGISYYKPHSSVFRMCTYSQEIHGCVQINKRFYCVHTCTCNHNIMLLLTVLWVLVPSYMCTVYVEVFTSDTMLGLTACISAQQIYKN